MLLGKAETILISNPVLDQQWQQLKQRIQSVSTWYQSISLNRK